jgi:hypothetical protein
MNQCNASASGIASRHRHNVRLPAGVAPETAGFSLPREKSGGRELPQSPAPRRSRIDGGTEPASWIGVEHAVPVFDRGAEDRRFVRSLSA